MAIQAPEAVTPSEPKGSSITIVRKTAAQLEQVGYLHDGIAQLLRYAFDFQHTSLEQLIPHLKKVFGEGDALLAYQGPDLAGAFAVRRFIENDKGVGQRFWENLGITKEPGIRQNLREIAEVKFPLEAMQITTTIVAQTDKGKEVYARLLEAAAGGSSLVFNSVTGPDEALINAQVLAKMGYYVFLNRSEITPGREAAVDLRANNIRDALLETTGQNLVQGGVIYTDKRPFVPTHPSAYYATDFIKQLFKESKPAREAAPPGLTAEVPIIAIPSKVWRLLGDQIHARAA